MTVQRGKLHSAYDNINWGEGVKSHAGEIAEDFVQRQNKRYEEYKKSYSDLGGLIDLVHARDGQEALQQVINSRDELMATQKQYGVGSMEYIQKQEELLSKHKAIAQKSKMFDQDFLRAAALAKSDPNVRQLEAQKMFDAEIGKSILDRNPNLESEIRRNPTIYNVDSFTKSKLDEVAPVTNYDWVTSDPEKIVTNRMLFRNGIVNIDKDNPDKYSVKIPDSVVDQIYNSNPELFNTDIDLASKAQAGKKDENGNEVGDVIQNIKNQGGGADALLSARKAFLASKLAASQDLLPKKTILKVDEKSIPWNYMRTAGGAQEQRHTESIKNLASYLKDRDEGSEKVLQSLFGKIDDGQSVIKFAPNGDLLYIKRVRPGTKLDSKTKSANKQQLADKLGITKEELDQRPEYKDMYLEQAFPVSGGTEEGLLTAAASIHKKVGETNVKYGKTKTTGSKKKNPMTD